MHICPSSHTPGAPSLPALPGKLALFRTTASGGGTRPEGRGMGEGRSAAPGKLGLFGALVGGLAPPGSFLGLPSQIGFVFPTPVAGPMRHNSFPHPQLSFPRAIQKLGLFGAVALRSSPPSCPPDTPVCLSLGSFGAFALHPAPPGPVPPDLAGNWLCLYNRPPLARRPRLASFYSSHFTLQPSNFFSIGFVWRNRLTPVARRARNWLCFAKHQSRGP